MEKKGSFEHWLFFFLFFFFNSVILSSCLMTVRKMRIWTMNWTMMHAHPTPAIFLSSLVRTLRMAITWTLCLPNSFILAMHIGNNDHYMDTLSTKFCYTCHAYRQQWPLLFTPFSVTLAEGHKVSRKQNLFGLFASSVFNWSAIKMILSWTNFIGTF